MTDIKDEWKTIEGFSRYIANSKGEVKNKNSGRPLKQKPESSYNLIDDDNRNTSLCIRKILMRRIPKDITEEWKTLPNTDGRYEVSNLGKVISSITKKSVISLASNGYQRAAFSNDGKTSMMLVHILIIENFGPPKPSSIHTVNHIDGNKLNNHINNLQWATASEQSIHAHSNNLIKYKTREIVQRDPDTKEIIAEFKSCKEAYQSLHICEGTLRKLCESKTVGYKGILIEYKEEKKDIINYPDEIWKPSKYSEVYEISTYGRVKNVTNGILLEGSKIKAGYIAVTLRSANQSFLLHRLVAEEFIEKEDPDYNIVDHIDGDRSNNHVSNLRWCSNQQNISFSKGIAVKRIKPDNSETIIFNSIRSACTSLHKSAGASSSIKSAIQTKTLYYGYMWEYVNK